MVPSIYLLVSKKSIAPGKMAYYWSQYKRHN